MVLVGRDDEEAYHAAELSAAVGVTNLAGFLAGGFTSWREERLPVDRIPRLTVQQLHEQCGLTPDPRRPRTGRVGLRPHPRFGPLPYHDLDALPEGLDPAEPVAVICGSGQRAAVGASLIEGLGAEQPIHVVDGGVGTWARHGWPIEPD